MNKTNFSKEVIQWPTGSKTMFMSLIIREMQTKTIFLHLLEWLSSAETSDNNVLARKGEKVNIRHCWWKCKLTLLRWNNREIPQKQKNRTTIRSSNPTFRYILKRYSVIPVIATLFIVGKVWKLHKCPSCVNG